MKKITLTIITTIIVTTIIVTQFTTFSFFQFFFERYLFLNYIHRRVDIIPCMYDHTQDQSIPGHTYIHFLHHICRVRSSLEDRTRYSHRRNILLHIDIDISSYLYYLRHIHRDRNNQYLLMFYLDKNVFHTHRPTNSCLCQCSRTHTCHCCKLRVRNIALNHYPFGPLDIFFAHKKHRRIPRRKYKYVCLGCRHHVWNNLCWDHNHAWSSHSRSIHRNRYTYRCCRDLSPCRNILILLLHLLVVVVVVVIVFVCNIFRE